MDARIIPMEEKSFFEDLFNSLGEINPELGDFEEITALLSLPDEQFNIISEIFLDEMQKALNSNNEKLQLLQGLTTMGGNSEESNLSLGYVMVPVMLQVYPTKSFYIEVGPEFAMNLSHSPNNIAISSSQLNLKNFKPNDIMLGAGLGFMFGGFNIGARYSYGFSDMASNLPWRNSLIQLNLGYLFQIKKKAIKVF